MDTHINLLLRKISEDDDEAAFRNFFDTYYQKLFHLALYFIRSKELAEEIVSDVFFIIWKRRKALGDVDDIEKYLYTSTKNQALHYIRRSPVIDKIPLGLYTIHLLHDENNPEEKLLSQEYRALIQKAIDSLPDKCKEVFRLVLSDKLKHKQIAQLLNISEKTVEAHITTAYKRIALYVNKEYSNPKTIDKMLSIFF
ncbi:RNA polymerase sigma-70 factor [Parabacteroides pacaensis]|uniref:RNA polymerase sigma-70 factor n=1 Tax=Parabacteroides pacaensis TaxID=2086575 RepID=UPI0018FF06AA|nr:RNA polymerase sigma-70 factor [Parabacteroides pacaensis]